MEEDKFALTLQDYRNQRQYREEKRKEFMRRFQNLKQKMNFVEDGRIDHISQPIQPTQKAQKV